MKIDSRLLFPLLPGTLLADDLFASAYVKVSAAALNSTSRSESDSSSNSNATPKAIVPKTMTIRAIITASHILGIMESSFATV
jgi:hypothetical protein